MDDARGSSRPGGWAEGAERARWGLLGALAVDNLGSGLFLPLVLVYSTQVVGLSLAAAGATLFVGSLLGLLVPGVVGVVVDRLGARRVVLASLLVQAAGMLVYLLAGSATGRGAAVVGAVAGAVLVAAGTQTFYSSLFSLIAAVAGEGPKDRAFAHVEMVRSAAFGLGALVGAGLLTWLDAPALRIAVAVDAVSFLVAAVLLRWLVDAAGPRAAARAVPALAGPTPAGSKPSGPAPWRDRPFLGLLLLIALTGLATDVFLVGFAVWAVDQVGTRPWLPGACVALLTALTSTCAALVVRWTATWRRTRVIALGAVLTTVWSAACALTPLLTPSWRAPWLLAATVVLAAAGLLGGRVMVVAEATAPPAAHGRYLATVQYSFTAAQLLAPLVVGLFAVALWLPWAAVAAACGAALLLVPWLARRLPAHAVSAPG
ncbi:MFS transporter [Kineococcus sp. R8]|uniref:MFS transporter n=1 Tax=Kineococcus siccus TaxID=2696567 RepID=UPI00196A5F89|nr:MFS transporter [Kineococcus siccus]NAZ82826.1 MFS transporter [Kineococcus siccus]